MNAPPGPDDLVSVIIPVYGTAAYVKQALESVFAQTYPHYEIILVNDGSPDSALLETVIAPYRHRIVYIAQENRGSSAARNTAIKAARGNYVAMLDSDDYWAPRYLESQIAVLKNDPKIDAVYPDAFRVTSDGRRTWRFSQEFPCGGEICFLRVLRGEVQIYGGLTAKRATLMMAGLYDETVRTGEDFELWLRVLRAGGRIAYNDDVLAFYREREGSLTSDRTALVRNKVTLLSSLGKKLELTPAERAELDHQRARNASNLCILEAKQEILAGQAEAAIRRLGAALEQTEGWKIRAAIMGLKIAPRLMRRLYRVRARSERF